MTTSKGTKIIISIIIIAVLLGMYIFLDKRARDKEASEWKNSLVASSTTTTLDVGGTKVNIEGNGNYTVEKISSTAGTLPQPIPDLSSSVTFSSSVSLSPEARTVVNTKVSDLQSLLRKNPADFDSWISLGLYQKMAGDYSSAAASWQYAGKLSPTSFVQFGNLGDLYAYYLKDTAQAEVYYKKAISNGPTQAYLYIQLATVYKDIFNDLAMARAVVDQGLAKIPNDSNLLRLKAELNK